MANKKFLDNNGLLYFWQKIVSAFVKKDGSKVLSDNNYSTEEKNKLAGLENYTLPKATTTTLGGIKAGAGVEVTEDGTLNATGGGTADSVDWSNVQNKPTKLSEFQNDSGFQTASDVQGSITAATTDMATKTYVTQQLANINKKQVVTSTTEMTDPNTIYLIANEGTDNNIYDEYLVINNKPEKIGTTAVDLTNYLQESDLVEISNGEIDTIVADL